MLNETTFQKLRQLATQKGGAEGAELLAGLDDLQKALVGQSQTIRTLLIQLDARVADQGRMRGLLESIDLAGCFARLGAPKRTSFTPAQLTSTLDELQAKIATAHSLGEIVGTVVQVAKLFV
jgi:hypothetical protein